MASKQSRINSPVAFDCGATRIVALLAQVVFVNLDKFKYKTL
jgi:hypothetical protein